VKDFTRQRWKGCIQNARSLQEAEDADQAYGMASSFRFPPVVTFDYTAALKFYPSDRVSNGHEYMTKWFLPPINEAFDNGASVVIICFDLGSPPNKDLEHKKRYKNTEFMPIPLVSGTDIISDTVIPSPEQWEGFVNNKQLVGDLIHYITQRLLEPQANPDNTYTPPPGKTLLLHGGRSVRPKRDVFPVLLPAPVVHYLKNELVEERSSSCPRPI
jgi:hypothetical protein